MLLGIKTQRFYLKSLFFLFLLPSFIIKADGQIQDVIAQELKQIAGPKTKKEQEMAHAFYTLGINEQKPELKILTEHEYQELQVFWLTKTLDKTNTAFGSLALIELLNPVNDESIIKQRQEIIKTIAQDEFLYNRLEQLLQKIATHQIEALSFWNPNDSVLAISQRLYYNLPFSYAGTKNKDQESIAPDWVRSLSTKCTQFLNNNNLALDLGMLLEAKKQVTSLASVLFLSSLMNKFQNYFFFEKENQFSIGKWIKESLYEPISWGDPRKDKTADWKDLAPGESRTKADYLNATMNGTMGDRYVAMRDGFDDKVFKGYFFSEGRRLSPVLAGGAALGTAIAYYGFWGMRAYDVMKNFNSALEAMKEVRARTTSLALFIKDVQEFARTISFHPILGQSELGKQIRLFNSKKISENVSKLVVLLDSVDSQKKSGLVYSRGKVLLAFKLFTDIKQELVPLLRAIGELDAYHMFATYAQNGWEFVDFVQANGPVLHLRNYTIPVLDKAVTNSISFGEANKPTKLLMTGPNGGGKSVTLKLIIGQSVVLAQSVGLLPAQQARMTMFNGIRTCVSPKENMKKGLSTFMAEKAGMDALYNFIRESDPTKKYIVLADEPYRGTVNDATARRTGQFCSWVIDKRNILVGIATHIMPELTDRERQAFMFNHVEILEPRKGEFVRTFKINPDICRWWFEDQLKRDRYIDWLATQHIAH